MAKKTARPKASKPAAKGAARSNKAAAKKATRVAMRPTRGGTDGSSVLDGAMKPVIANAFLRRG